MSTEWRLMVVADTDRAELEAQVLKRASRDGARVPSVSEVMGREAQRAEVTREAFAAKQGGTWSDDDLRKLASGQFTTWERFAVVMDELVQLRAKNGGRDTLIPTSEVAKRTGLSAEEWRAACKKMNGKHRAIHFPDLPEENWWPLVEVMGRRMKVTPDELYVGITAKQAERWVAVR